MTCDLPELAIQKIVQHLADDVSVHSLVSLASLSRSWRSIVRQTPIATLKLDSAQDLQHPAFLQTDPLACKFLRVDLDTKTAFFTAAAKLLKRHSGIQLKGQAITDSVLAELARGGAENLTSAIIEGSNKVTDASLTALVLLCPNLRHLHLLSVPSVRGAFLPTLLRRANQLESLSLSNLPVLNWDFLTLCCSKTYVLPQLRALTLEDVKLNKTDQGFFSRFPRLRSLTLSCCPPAVWAAAQHCPELEEVVLTTNSPICTDDCLAALLSAPSLRVLELCPKSFTLSSEQLRLAGMLNLRELRLESHTFKQQPLNRVGQSHIDNEGVKALVDSICTRCLFQRGKQPFKLSLCGATAITHDAVSALLRLPLLSGLLLEGCYRISSIDKMRLVAKVKAGRELVEGGSKKKAAQPKVNLLISCAA